jgi:hypothetical protein
MKTLSSVLKCLWPLGSKLTLGFLLVACAVPRPILKLKPIAPETQFYFGKEYVSNNKGNLQMSVAFENSDAESFVMDVEIINRTNEKILIDPAKFYYQLADSLNKTYNVNAFDPERKILETEKEISREEARFRNNRTFLIVTAALAAASSVAVLASQNNGKKTSNETSRLNSVNSAQNTAQKLEVAADLINISSTALQGTLINRDNFEWNTQNLRELKENWEKFPLRKTHLYPNETIRGKIIYRSTPKNGNVLFKFPIEHIVHEFSFRQNLVIVGFE